MSVTFEAPISDLFGGGYDAVAGALRSVQGFGRVFVWLALIYLKTHLKDLSLRMHRDLRMPDDRIADLYDWQSLHHVHCVARSFIAGARIATGVFGSMILLPGKPGAGEHGFDYGDDYAGRSILLKLGDIALIAVLNDSGASANFLRDISITADKQPLLSKITGPLSRIQLREIMIHFAYTNIRLDRRPEFSTEIDRETELCTLEADIPAEFELREGDTSFYGRLLFSACQNALQSCQSQNALKSPSGV